MSKRVQVTLDEEDYRLLQRFACGQGTTVAGWARQAIHDALETKSKTVEAKLQAIAEASRHQHPTADIEVLLAEIEAGRSLPWTPDPP